MPVRDIVRPVKETVLHAALAYELHGGGDAWRRIFKRAINNLKTKSGRQYKFYVLMAAQSQEQMGKVVRMLDYEANR